MADVHFHDYRFAVDPAHGGTALATLPDRLGPRYSIVNVRDFGAIGNGVDNDAAAIQAAIDHVYEKLIGGVLFLPAGTYNLGTTRLRLTPDYASIPGERIMSIQGAGRDVTILKGNFGTGAGVPTSADPNFLCVAFQQFFTRDAAASGSSPYSIQDLTIWNTSTAAGSGALCLQFGTRQNLISNCRLIGTMGLYLAESSFGVCVENCLAQHVSTLAGFPSANAYAPFSYGSPGTSRGFWLQQGHFCNNIAIGFELGFVYSTGDQGGVGNACTFIGNRAYRCRTGFAVGYGGAAGQGDLGGGSLFISNRADRCEVGFVVAKFYGGQLAANAVTGASGPPEPAAISNMIWDNVTHVVTVTTSAAHNIANGQKIQLSTDLSAWFPSGNTTGIVTATVGGNSSLFTYPGPAASPPTFVSGTWTYPIRVAMEITSAGVIAANYVSDVVASYAHIDLSAFGTQSQTLSALTLMATYAPSWQFGFGGVNAYKCVGCSGPGIALSLSNVEALPLPNRLIEYFGATGVAPCGNGDVFNVTNSQALNFGATVSCGLLTNAQTNIGNNRLFFASTAGSGIVKGMRVYDDSRVTKVPGGTTVTNVGATFIDISNNIINPVPVGQLIIFDWAGGINRYKVRYDGTRWLRIG